MNNREKINELFDMCLYIQMRGAGENGYPYIDFVSTNYGGDVTIYISDNGFKSGIGYDGKYDISFAYVSDRTYQNCKKHLEDLKAEVDACTEDIYAQTAEHI